MPIFVYLFCLLSLLGASCTSSQGHSQTTSLSSLPSRDTLVEVLRDQRQVYVVYGSTSPQGPALTEQLRSLIDAGGGWLTFRLVADTVASDTLLSRHPHLLIGTPQSNRWLRRWQDSLPLRVEAGIIQFAGQAIDQPDRVLSLAIYPSPANAYMPMGLLTAQTDQALLDWLRMAADDSRDGPLSFRWGYQVLQGQQRQLLGMFTADWQPGGEPHWDFSREPSPALETAHLRVYQEQTQLSPDSLARLAASIEARIAGLRRWLDRPDLPFSPVALHLYPSAERMGLMQHVMEHAHARPDQGEVHRVVNAHYARRQLTPHEDLLPFVRQALGAPASTILETGLAVTLTPDWLREGHRYWAGRLAAGEGHLALGQLFDPAQYPTNSPLIKAAMAGLLIDFLVETWGKAELIARYPSWVPDQADLMTLGPAWQRYLQQAATAAPPQPWPHQPLAYYRGMTLAHEGYNIYDGYGSDTARASLGRLQGLQVNSVALVPYTGARSTSQPQPYQVWQRAGSENDAATVGSFSDAQALGMQTLLKPQIWFRGGWPGEVKMESEGDWQQFFAAYRQWIMHYALLAAVHEMDALCAGVEFAEATQRHPEAWRTLIRDLRQVYAGPVTYAANWGAEAENLAFAAELDFIGVNCYYPLSDKVAPTEAELRAGFARIKAKLAAISAQHGRPVVLTEVGFRCVSAPWTNPHAEPMGRGYDAEAQALAYEVVLSGLAEASWCQGMFWWKWPSYLGYAQRNLTSFTPCHRPAIEVITHWYGRLGR
jgi:hypothetical protein